MSDFVYLYTKFIPLQVRYMFLEILIFIHVNSQKFQVNCMSYFYAECNFIYVSVMAWIVDDDPKSVTWALIKPRIQTTRYFQNSFDDIYRQQWC